MANFILLITVVLAGTSFISYTAQVGKQRLRTRSPGVPKPAAHDLHVSRLGGPVDCPEIHRGASRLGNAPPISIRSFLTRIIAACRDSICRSPGSTPLPAPP